MLKILSTEQVREADKVTIERETIESVDLMERAAKACADWIADRYDQNRPIVVMAGVGNNGGDALVISRWLLDRGYQVQSYVVRYSESFSADLQINLDRLKAKGYEVTYILEESQFPSISSDTVIVDGLFGSGLNRPPKGLASLCIEQINASIADVVSIDLPSGLFADQHTSKDASVIEASYTLTFQVPKLAFFVPENQHVIGEWTVVDIGLDPAYMNMVESTIHYVDSVEEYSSVFHRDQYDHKGMFGHGLLIAGSYGKMGAAVLAGRAALHSGIGRLTMHVPHSGYNIIQTSVPEAMCTVDDYDEHIGELPELAAYNTVGVGPGLGTNKKTRRMLKALLQSSKAPVVLDADALNLLADNKDLVKALPKRSILTPHVGEFERLFGQSGNSFERLSKLKDNAVKLNSVIILKGAHTAIAAPNGQIYINSTGNPGLATAGSGDALTGIITSFVSQVEDPLIAAICGVYVHGLAGDIAAERCGQHGLTASDVIEDCGKAIVKALHP